MKTTHTFVVQTTISLGIDIEADSLEEAIAAAKEASIKTLCHQCAASSRGEWSTSGEIDGDAENGTLVDYYGPDNDEDRMVAFHRARTAWAQEQEET
jgi:hypothetical protein